MHFFFFPCLEKYIQGKVQKYKKYGFITIIFLLLQKKGLISLRMPVYVFGMKLT